MKAPDKIYVLLNEHTGFLSHTFTNVPCGYESSQDIEYIRKDAMLERLKKAAEEYKKRSDEGELVWQNMCGINEAIGILNNM